MAKNKYFYNLYIKKESDRIWPAKITEEKSEGNERLIKVSDIFTKKKKNYDYAVKISVNWSMDYNYHIDCIPPELTQSIFGEFAHNFNYKLSGIKQKICHNFEVHFSK